MGTSTGVYGVELDVAPSFSGSIVWSTTSNSNVYASEEIKSDQRMARLIHTGRWKIDATTKQMIFYQEDNSSVIARYGLYDKSGNP